MRFAVDRMLGRLGRWLRIVGQDAAYGPHLAGRALVALARRDGRIILTRDTRLLRQRHLPPYLFIEGDRFREQLRQVVAAYDLDVSAALFTRCLECNEPLSEAPRASAERRVPDYVWATQQRFHACPRCGRLYWPATHLARARTELARLGLLGSLPADDAGPTDHSPR
jgi:uncharacterized protein with PIN domain